MTVGRKAASWGYKKYGVPGAVATGAAGVAGYLAVRSAMRRMARKADVGSGSGREDSTAESRDDERAEATEATR